MEPMEALQITRYLSEAYPRDPWSEERFALWADAIADLDHQATVEAAKRWVRTEKWPPSVAEIRELSGFLREERRRQNIRVLEPTNTEPELTPERREANRKRVNEILGKLAGGS